MGRYIQKLRVLRRCVRSDGFHITDSINLRTARLHPFVVVCISQGINQPYLRDAKTFTKLADATAHYEKMMAQLATLDGFRVTKG